MKSDVIIIGGGQAGLMTAVTLRQKKFKGSLLLISSENYLPYQRPPLSKDFISNNLKEEQLYFKREEYYKKNAIQILLNTSVIQINKKLKKITLSDGQEYSYEKLVIATGSTLNELDLNCSKNNIHYLRSLDDSIEIKNTLATQKKIVIIGAGYIGLEIASAAIKNNLQVLVLEMDKTIMGRTISKEASDFLYDKHKKKGVEFSLNTKVKDINDHGEHKRVACSNGIVIDADAVIIGTGIKPNIDLANKSGLLCENGILVNEYCQTSDKDIFAAGDCTNHPNKVYNTRLRLESVHNAVEQGKTAGAAIMGNSEPYNQVPWFWTNQYDIKLQIAGIYERNNDSIVRGDIELESFSIFHMKNNKIIAVEAINDNKSFLLGKKLIQKKLEIPKKVIEDKNFDIKQYIRK
tara:strand:+ start:2888 stop:4105 length:1218 start_codon:yes stop_codon:yes gene_type:complete